MAESDPPDSGQDKKPRPNSPPEKDSNALPNLFTIRDKVNSDVGKIAESEVGEIKQAAERWIADEYADYKAQEPPKPAANSDIQQQQKDSTSEPAKFKGVRVFGSRSHSASTPESERHTKLGAFLREQGLQAVYDAADDEQKQIIWAANERAFEDAEKRKEQRRKRELELRGKIFDALARLREDPAKKDLLPPDNASMEELEKWYEGMSRPLHRPDYGNPPDAQPQQGVNLYKMAKAVADAEAKTKTEQPKGDEASEAMERLKEHEQSLRRMLAETEQPFKPAGWMLPGAHADLDEEETQDKSLRPKSPQPSSTALSTDPPAQEHAMPSQIKSEQSAGPGSNSFRAALAFSASAAVWSLAVNVLNQKYGTSIPDWTIVIAVYAAAGFWLYWAWHTDFVQRRRTLVYTYPRMALASMVLTGMIVGGGAGALLWWTIQRERRALQFSGQQQVANANPLHSPVPNPTTATPIVRADVEMAPSPNASASIGATPAPSEPPPPKASELNPYQGFRLHRVVPDVERTYTIRPSPFVKVDIPVRIDAEWLAPEIAGRALVAYVSEVDAALPGRDVAACTTLISRFKEIKKEMADALKKSNTGESIGIADALILYHGGALSQEQKHQISSEARYRHLEITILGPTK
jgi:hypothetical protein